MSFVFVDWGSTKGKRLKTTALTYQNNKFVTLRRLRRFSRPLKMLRLWAFHAILMRMAIFGKC